MNSHVCAFARNTADMWAVTVVPLFLTELTGTGRLPHSREVWGEDTLYLPGTAPAGWENVFTGEHLTTSPEDNTIPLSQMFGSFPVVLLVNRKTT